jgi:hypothetical protein
MCPDAGSVYAAPNKSIVGEAACIVPVDLARHKILNAAF